MMKGNKGTDHLKVMIKYSKCAVCCWIAVDSPGADNGVYE